MIAHLSGLLLSKQPNSVIVDINGVGYEVTIPLSTFYDLSEEGYRRRASHPYARPRRRVATLRLSHRTREKIISALNQRLRHRPEISDHNFIRDER